MRTQTMCKSGIESAKSDAIGDMVAITKEVEFSDLSYVGDTTSTQIPTAKIRIVPGTVDPDQDPLLT